METIPNKANISDISSITTGGNRDELSGRMGFANELQLTLERIEKILLQLLVALPKEQEPKVYEDEWLDNADLKMLLKISSTTIWRLRMKNKIPAQKIARKWYYAKSAIQHLMNP